MKRKTQFFLRYLLIALLSCGVTLCGVALYSRENRDVFHFALWLSLGAGILILLCLLLSYFLPRDDGEELKSTVLHLNQLNTSSH